MSRSRDERRVVTFYSYKGGVGRTMTLANVAWRLAARHGLRVVVVDWDLEAPGLHEYFGIGPEVSSERKGVLEFLLEWMDSVERRAEELPDLSTWLVPVDDGAAAPPSGSVSVLLAGRLDAQYTARLASLDGERFYDDIASGVAFDALKAQLVELADVVLVDSRAGLTPSGRVCTTHVADAVVLMTPATEPAVPSIERVARAIVGDGTRADGRRSPRVWLTVCHAPVVEEGGMVQAWLDRWREWFTACENDGLWRWDDHPSGIASHVIPYRARWSFGDTLLTDEARALGRDPLSEAYDRLSAALYEWSSGDAWENGLDGVNPDARIQALQSAVRAAEVRRDIPGTSAGLMRLAMAFLDHRRLDEAVAIAERAAGIELARNNVEEAASRTLFVAQCLRMQRRHGRVAESLDRVFEMPRSSLYAEWIAAEALVALYHLQRERGEHAEAERTRISVDKIDLDDHVGGRRRRLREVADARIKIERTALSAAWQVLERELRTAVETSDTVHESRALEAMAVIRFRQMRFEAALSLSRQSVALDRRTGRWGDHAEGLAFSARCERRLGRFDRAKELAESAIAVARDCESAWCEGVAVAELAQIHVARGQFESAALLAQRALVLAAQGGHRECEIVAERCVARVRIHEQRVPEARSTLEFAVRGAREVGLRELEAALLRDLADVHLLQENPSQAVNVLRESAELLRGVGSHVEELASLRAALPILHDEGLDATEVDARARELRALLSNEGVDLTVAALGVYA